ncbi:OmpA family protein [Marinilongibacter aquaticus]|uniref:OmpA family protein n=1 Tax=Marinilongibacter aquaticus TaxID=2975157 RepID=UPI0021BDE692|nr:OmpA family protein [Marinilongibacter aquaticus]UBM58867.1 OmpA family protein [Marinilongibacter aquaticus]
MKRNFAIGLSISFLLLCAVQSVFAQSSLKSGNKAYDKQSYVLAVKRYEEYVDGAKTGDKDLPEALSKLAYSYKKLQDYRNAERVYRILFRRYEKILDSKEYLYFAQVLASLSQYRESQLYYSKYGQMQAEDERAKKFSVAYMDISPFFRDSALYHVDYVEAINSRQADFSPMYFGKGLAFVSSRDESGSVKRVYMNNETPFLDLFLFPDTTALLTGELIAEGMDASKPFSKNLNSKFHEGPMAFFKDEKQIIFTRNNYEKSRKKSGNGVNNLKLFSAKYTGSEWDYVEELPFNSDDFSCGHPTLNVENSQLYFISDMPGGFGGTDLYVVDYNRGQWSSPRNLGPEINTEGNEMFPFIDEFDNLYFASDGQAGLGGLDVFFVEMENGKPTGEPVNLGAPINSPQDDFGLITNGYRTSGFFSSNRKKGFSDDNIYTFKKQCRALTVLVYDAETKEAIGGSEVRLLDHGVNKELYMTNENGEVQICLTAGLNFEFKAFKAGYESNSVTYATMVTSPEAESLVKIFLLPSKLPLVRGTIRSELTNEPIGGATVTLTNLRDKSTATVITGKDGRYEFQPTKKGQYVVSAVKDRYAQNTEIVGKVRGLFKNRETYEQNLGMVGEGDLYRIENIYYDYGKHTIRKDAKRSLNDRVMPLLQKYPQIEIEIRSHTDSRSSAEFNQKLSEQRAQEVVLYLQKRGISANRLKFHGYGESQLVNECADGVDCSEEMHQQNRRTEFLVLKVTR